MGDLVRDVTGDVYLPGGSLGDLVGGKTGYASGDTVGDSYGGCPGYVYLTGSAVGDFDGDVTGDVTGDVPPLVEVNL